MPTTLKAFVKLIATPANVLAVVPNLASQLAPTNATRLDLVTLNAASDGNAKHGCASVDLVGTTPVTLDLTNLATNSTTSAGDTSFSTWKTIVLVNTGAADLTVEPGASNPARLLLSGTSPKLTIPAGTSIALASVAGLAVDSTHKTVTVTPTAGGGFAWVVSGS